MARGKKRALAEDGPELAAVTTTTHTRTCYLARAMLPGIALDGTELTGAARINRQNQIHANINTEVVAVSAAMRNGSKFFEMWLRMLLRNSGDVIPADFPWWTAIAQATAAMQKKVRKKQVQVPGYAAADAAWQALYDRDEYGVILLAQNTLTAECNAYYRTLLKNYTRISLSAHTLWALRYRFPEFAHTLKKIITGRARVGTAALPQAEYDALPLYARNRITECFDIVDAKFGNETLSRAATFRWRLLDLIDRVERHTIATGRPQMRQGKHGQMVEVLPKRFLLVPQASRAARFLTFDKQCARRMLGLPALPAPGEPAVFAEPLQLLFSSTRISKWNRQMRIGNGGDPFPATVKTDGVQLHIPYTKTGPAPIGVGKKADLRQADGTELRRQLASHHPHGLFTMDAAVGCPIPAHVQAVGVDPGIRNLIATSTGVKVTRADYYGSRKPRTLFDPGPLRVDEIQYGNGKGHSRRTRCNRLPRPIHNLQDQLSQHAIRSAGRNNDTFVANLEIWLESTKALQTYYGSKEQRGRRLHRSMCGRRTLDKVVDLVAPDPRTVVVFGANFYGRCCRTGDVAGPIPVKAIRRKLAKHRVVVAADEYNTTRLHFTCHGLLEQHPDDAHEKWCPRCGIAVDRDSNAALNIREVWLSHVRTGRRPAYLARPATVPAPVFVSVEE